MISRSPQPPPSPTLRGNASTSREERWMFVCNGVPRARKAWRLRAPLPNGSGGYLYERGPGHQSALPVLPAAIAQEVDS